MNHNGPVPLMVHMKYFTTPGSSGIADAPSGITDGIRELNQPTAAPMKSRPMVDGTSSLRVRDLNHSPAGFFSNA